MHKYVHVSGMCIIPKYMFPGNYFAFRKSKQATFDIKIPVVEGDF